MAVAAAAASRCEIGKGSWQSLGPAAASVTLNSGQQLTGGSVFGSRSRATIRVASAGERLPKTDRRAAASRRSFCGKPIGEATAGAVRDEDKIAASLPVEGFAHRTAFSPPDPRIRRRGPVGCDRRPVLRRRWAGSCDSIRGGGRSRRRPIRRGPRSED